MELVNGEKMNNFIEINSKNSLHRNILINLNSVTSIVRFTPVNKEEYWINLTDDESYEIDKEQYEEIKAKLIDNNSKE